MAIYDQIGSSYDSTRKADPKIVRRMLANLQPKAGGQYLDLACGTGSYTLEYMRSGLTICGVDQSELMLARARNREASITWKAGKAENLPFENDSFDGITCTNAIHHFEDLGAVFKECARVLRSGTLAIFCSTQEQMQAYWLNHYFPVMMTKSIAQMPARSRILGALAAAGFEAVNCEGFCVEADLQDFFLYSGKQRPRLYLSEEFRNNISSFAALADADEVKEGLQALRADIENGSIGKIIQPPASGLGDYLIVSATKTLPSDGKTGNGN